MADLTSTTPRDSLSNYIFGGFHDFYPYFKLSYGEFKGGKFVELYNFGKLYFDSLTSLKTVEKIKGAAAKGKPAGTPLTMSLDLEFGAASGDFDAIPILVKADTELPEYKEAAAASKKENKDTKTVDPPPAPLTMLFTKKLMVLQAGYTNFSKNNNIRLYKISDVKDINKATNDYSKITDDFYEATLPDTDYIFSGFIGNPKSIVGGEDATIKLSFDLQLLTNVPSTGFGGGKGKPPEVAKGAINAKQVFELVQKKYFPRTLDPDFPVSWDLSALAKYSNFLKGDELGGSQLVTCGYFETPNEFLNRICLYYAINYNVLTRSDGSVSYVFAPNTNTAGMQVFQQSGLWQFGKNAEAGSYAVYLLYGEGVVSFSYSYTPTAGAAGNGKKGTQVSFLNEKAEIVTYEVSHDKLQRFYDAGNRMEDLISLADGDPDVFISNFTIAKVQGKNDKEVMEEGKGNSGVKINLKLRYAIPGIRTGYYVFFDLPPKVRNTLGKYLVGVYKITEVKNNFNPKENAWSQELDISK